MDKRPQKSNSHLTTAPSIHQEGFNIMFMLFRWTLIQTTTIMVVDHGPRRAISRFILFLKER